MKAIKKHLNIDMYGNFLFALLFYFFPNKMLDFNFKLKKYDSIHIHFAKIFGLYLLLNALLSNYLVNKECEKTRKKLLEYKLVIYVLILVTMIIDNSFSKLMGQKHIIFGMIGLILLILNTICALKFIKIND